MVLLGFKLLPDPNVNEVRSLFEEQAFLEPKWKDLCKAQGVSVQDTQWVQAVGAFKTAYTWVGTLCIPHSSQCRMQGLLAQQGHDRVITAFALICNAPNRPCRSR